MNEQQRQAIKSVERAMVELKRSGLATIGVDGDLVAVDLGQYRKHDEGNPIGDTLNLIGYHVIESNYIDSCAT